MFADFRVHGLNEMGKAPPFSFPASRCRPVVKALEKGLVQPMYAKVREHGAPVQGARPVRKREICRTTPVQGARLGGKPGKRRRNDNQPRNRAKVVHFSFNSPSANHLPGMTKFRVAY